MFNEGFCLVSESGNHLVVQKLLGRGGRRDVYEVLISETGERKALRWFREGYGNFDHKVHENLAFLSRIGCPDKSILWVEDVVSTGDAGFGYVTRLIPNGFVPFYKLVRERELSEVSKCNFALDYLRALHNANTQGLLLFTADGEANCYVHAQTGHLLIDECERTTIRGSTLYPMMYVHKYAAPEVILGKNELDIYTNRFSMAVVLFFVFFYGHPLEGKQTTAPCLTPSIIRKVYGEYPVFIFDQDDTRNRPIPIVHSKVISSWEAAPDYVKNIFIKAFSQEALHNPKARPNEKELAQVIYRYKAEITMQ